MATIQEVVRFYRQRYSDLQVMHFHEKLQVHGITQSYTWVKTVLQNAGLIERRSRREKHRRRRPRRPLPGMLLHLDASRHCRMPLVPEQQDDLLVLLDDATNQGYETLLVPKENTWSVYGCCAIAPGPTACSVRSIPTEPATSLTPRCRAGRRIVGA